MKNKKEEIPSINWDEFLTGFISTSMGRGGPNKTSRSAGITSSDVSVIDKLTGLKESIQILEGHYSRKEMQKLRKEAIEKMAFSLLEKRAKISKARKEKSD